MKSISVYLILAVGFSVTLLALLESWSGWWYAPFPLAHAFLTILLPIRLKYIVLEHSRTEIRSHLRFLVTTLAFAVLFIGSYVLVYHFVLSETGKTSDPNWNLVITYQNLGRLYIARYSRPVVLIVSYILLGVWPMFGEEFFYRGFVFKGLSYHMSPLMAACISSLLFGLRHAFQLSYLLPIYPFVSGLAYFIWATAFGLLWSWTFYHTKSLWYCIGTHSINLLLAPFVLALLGK